MTDEAGKIQCTVTLDLKTCPCGTVYAVPNWVVNYQCPTCAARKFQEIEDKLNDSQNENVRLQRVISGLRGALNRKRRVR